MKKIATELLKFTEGTRKDFHEPDEQGISLVGVVGTKLDNAFGGEITLEALQDGRQEAVVCLKRVTSASSANRLQIDLATLIALARIGAKTLIEFDWDC